jgi:hypothetical protein
MRKHPFLSGLLTIAAAGFFAACSDDPWPVKPSPLSPSEVASIEVTGPDSIGAGQSVQFVATIRQADGTTKSATSMTNLRWRSSNPSLISVSSSGVVTAANSEKFDEPSVVDEAMITAEIAPAGAVQGTRKIVMRPRADVTAALEVGQQETAGRLSYVFSVKFTESAGVPASVTSLWITLDEGWGGQCIVPPDKLSQMRLPANGTLALDPLTCGFEESLNVVVSIWVTDDNGYKTYIEVRRKL